MVTVNSSLLMNDKKSVLGEALFSLIANDITTKGYSIQECALPTDLLRVLSSHQKEMSDEKFTDAGIGRGEEFTQETAIRTDEICWITGSSDAGSQWLTWANELRLFLNKHLFLGLFSFESHFAHYGTGDFYKRHYDAFRGEANRILSLVVYLNESWSESDGGKLVLYENDKDKTGVSVTPTGGTIVAFLSEEFPHEVLPTRKDRFSIAGWFRVNTSVTNRVDPPT